MKSKFVDDTFSDVRSKSDSSKVCVKSSFDPTMEIFEPFVHNGFVSLKSDLNNATPVKILRDTGCSQSLLLADTLPFSDKSYSGTNVLIKGVDSLRYSSVLLHNVYLSSNLVSGPVVLGIKPSLPFEGIHLLLGNDLAGDKVVGGPLLTNKPCCDQTPDPIEQEIPGFYPSCAVTRAMHKKQTVEEDVNADIDLSNTFLGKVFENDQFNDTYESNFSKENLSKERFSNQGQPISKSSLIVEQKRDSDISPLFQNAVNDNDISIIRFAIL